MSNLSKIKNLTKSLYNEFGDTAAGQGYLMILKMIEKEEYAVPYSISSLRKSILDKAKEHGIHLSYLGLEIKSWTDSVEYSIFLLEQRISEKTPANFYKKCMEVIENNSEAYLVKQNLKIAEEDISLK